MTAESTETPPPIETAFITFYSFKGGVGRSMALINVAGIMASRGLRVLAVDLDLEAPGLSYLVSKPEHGQNSALGFVDLLHDAITDKEQHDLFDLPPAELVERYTLPYELPAWLKGRGSLHIMPAGRLDACYQARVDELALGELYKEGYGKAIVQAFKTVLREAKRFDVVLVDSRTGFSDESGICTRDLGQHLLLSLIHI